MASPYTSQSATNYNASPPSDDGSETASNRITWAVVKSKLADVLKTFSENINTANVAAFGKTYGSNGVGSTAVDYTIQSADQGKLVKVTASGVTITTPDATDVGAPFCFALSNVSSGSITLDGSGSQTVDGAATVSIPAGAGVTVETDGSNWYTHGQNFNATLPRGYIDGCILSNGTDATNDINIAAGSCRDSTNTVDIDVPAISGKQLDANWAAGGSAGMRNSAVGIADGTYHIYAVRTATSRTADIYAHTSTTVATVLTALQAETGGSGYLYARIIGSIVRESSAIVGFVQDGDEFLRKVPKLSTSTAPSTTAADVTLDVPTGVKVKAIINARVAENQNALVSVLIYSKDMTDAAASVTAAPGVNLASASGGATTSASGGQYVVRTDTAGKVRWVATGNTDDAIMVTVGWIHRRGRDS